MRIKLIKTELDELFYTIKDQGLSWGKVAGILQISERSLNDWRWGKISMPQEAYLKCLAMAKFHNNKFKPLVLNNFWHINEAAKKGARARMKIYGNLGTAEGRKAGGLASLKTHKIKNTGFKILQPITQAKASEDLAELMGILIGDGHLSNYQVSMTTNSITDIKHAFFVKDLIVKIFNLHVKVAFKKNENAMTVVASSKNLVNLLHSKGMPIGNKIKNNLSIPAWVMEDIKYQKAFIRGLFDTDGCVYLDKHLIKGKMYKHIGWTITSYAGRLIAGIIEILKNLNLNPTYQVSQKSVFLRRQNEVAKYFAEIGTHNNKHQGRYFKFRGEVPKWS